MSKLSDFNFPPTPDFTAVFNEEFVIDNLACTTKISILADAYPNTLSYCRSKSTEKKETYILRFRGTWEDLKWTLRTICQAGISFYRNVHFYEHNQTRLLMIDFDGHENARYGLGCWAAECLLASADLPELLLLPSARCNYEQGSLDEMKVKKYHAFVLTKPYDCRDSKTVAMMSKCFGMQIGQFKHESDVLDVFPYDPALTKPWQRVFSKSIISEELEKIPTINVRFKCKLGTVFEYRNFVHMFNRPFITLEKCDKYVPNAERKTCKNAEFYSVPPFGGINVDEEKEKKPKKDKSMYRDFWEELKAFAGLTSKGTYKMPHYAVGRICLVKEKQRNVTATKIMWGIVFNIYSAERFSGKKMKDAEDFAISWFYSVFNKSNVEGYEEFMNGFNPFAEYSRKREDTEALEAHFDKPWAFVESKFRNTVKVGLAASYEVGACETREDLKKAAEATGMSRATMYRKACKLKLPTVRTSKLDKYVGLPEEELTRLVKSGVLNRMDKSRIMSRSKSC